MNNFIVISFIIAFLYGIIPGLIKYILKDINVFTLLLCEAIGVFVFTGILSIYQIENITKDMNRITFRSIYSIGILSFVVFLANCLLYLVLFRYDSYIVSAIVSCSPIFALLVSFFVVKEAVSFMHIFGIFLIVCGVWCISS